jgi:hypothetical protein
MLGLGGAMLLAGASYGAYHTRNKNILPDIPSQGYSKSERDRELAAIINKFNTQNHLDFYLEGMSPHVEEHVMFFSKRMSYEIQNHAVFLTGILTHGQWGNVKNFFEHDYVTIVNDKCQGNYDLNGFLAFLDSSYQRQVPELLKTIRDTYALCNAVCSGSMPVETRIEQNDFDRLRTYYLQCESERDFTKEAERAYLDKLQVQYPHNDSDTEDEGF